MLSAFSEAPVSPGFREQPLRALSQDKILYNLVGAHPNPTPFCLNRVELSQSGSEKRIPTIWESTLVLYLIERWGKLSLGEGKQSNLSYKLKQ